MTVNEWFSSGCNYKKGVAIYTALPNANRNFVRVFNKKESMQNLMKLKYELQKHLQPTAVTTKIAKSTSTSKRVIDIKINGNPKPTPKPQSKYHRQVLISQLPVQLHQLYIQQKTDYNTYCSLKMQLLELTNIRDAFGNLVLDAEGNPKVKEQTTADIEKALQFCLQIENLFDKIDKAWEIIDHYLDTKEVLKIETKDFTKLSPGKLRDKIVSVRGSRTRQKQRLAMLQEKEANAIAKKFKIKYARDVAKSKAKLAQLEQDLIQLIEIRDKEK